MSVIAPLMAPACLAEGVATQGCPRAIWQARFDRMSRLVGGSTTFTRATQAPYIDHQGRLAHAPADVAAFAHDGTGRNLGLACMAPRTNSLLHSRDLTQPAWAATDVTVARDAVGLDGIANSACTVSDGLAGERGSIDQTVAIPDDDSSHVATLHIAKDDNTSRFPLIQFDLVGGTILREQIWLDTSSGATEIESSQGSHFVEDAGDWWRVVLAHGTGTSGNTGARLRLRPANGLVMGEASAEAVGAIVIDMAQIHIGTSRAAGAPIATGATAVTRAADNAVVDLAGRLPPAFGFEVMWDADGGEEQYARVLEFNDGSADNLIALIRAGDQVQFNVVTAGALFVNANIGAWSPGRHRAVARIAPNGFAIAMDGAAPVSDGSGAVPTLDRLLPGHATGASWLDNTLASAAVWPWVPSNEALRALSARR